MRHRINAWFGGGARGTLWSSCINDGRHSIKPTHTQQFLVALFIVIMVNLVASDPYCRGGYRTIGTRFHVLARKFVIADFAPKFAQMAMALAELSAAATQSDETS